MYKPVFESGAEYFPSLFGWTITALVLYQITLIGIIILKVGIVQGPMLIPLPVLTLLFYSYCTEHYAPCARDQALFEAVRLLDSSADPKPEDLYHQMELTVKDLTLAEAIEEQEQPSTLLTVAANLEVQALQLAR